MFHNNLLIPKVFRQHIPALLCCYANPGRHKHNLTLPAGSLIIICIKLLRIKGGNPVKPPEIKLPVLGLKMRNAIELVVRDTIFNRKNAFSLSAGVKLQNTVIGAHPKLSLSVFIDSINCVVGKPIPRSKQPVLIFLPVPTHQSLLGGKPMNTFFIYITMVKMDRR